ncbi:helix-turn-helix domain-containing protein [Oceanobacillus luteolus]|uniref:Helix-turn-helix domain-containing protein n=1 Tax=Oceanobacillus luteolus TaxID=1274358 RepID=A0ABW4HS74_9BACI
MSEENFLSTNEAAKKLNVTVTTIYNYVKKGKLKPVYDDWSIDGMMLFHAEDIEKLRDEPPNGYTTAQAAKILGMHQTTISKQIKEGKIIADRIKYKGRMTYFISENTLNELIALRRKKAFNNLRIFSAKYQLYLYQSLINRQTNELGRVMEITRNGGYFITNGGEKIDLLEMKKHGFSPVERFHAKNPLNRVGYVCFRFTKPTSLHDFMYEVIETFYREAGYKNIQISMTEHHIDVQIKPILIEENMISYEFLKQHIVEGAVVKRHNGIFLDSEQERLTLDVSRKLKGQIKILAKENSKTIEEQAIELILKGLSNN